MIPLLVDLETEWRGGQNQALLLLKGLYERGHPAELVAANGSVLGKRAVAAGICVHYVSRGGLRVPAAMKIRGLLAGGRIELVHANEAHAVTSAWLAGAHRQVPVVISRRVGYPLGRSRFSRRRYEAAAKIVAISKWSAERTIESGAPQEKVTVVHEGVELPPAQREEARIAARTHWSLPLNAPVMGCAGVLSEDKGQEWLIRAMAMVRADYPECRLLLAGDGPDRERLDLLAQELGVTENVVFAGFVKEMTRFYEAVDIFVLPSLFEALSNALMSAMAHGVPSIAFDGSGPAEIIEDGVSGLTVPARNAEGLAQAMRKMLVDRDYAKRIGRGGRQRIEDAFSADRMVHNMISVYREALGTEDSQI